MNLLTQDSGPVLPRLLIGSVCTCLESSMTVFNQSFSVCRVILSPVSDISPLRADSPRCTGWSISVNFGGPGLTAKEYSRQRPHDHCKLKDGPSRERTHTSVSINNLTRISESPGTPVRDPRVIRSSPWCSTVT